ncbi:tRNA (guanosine(37)-N1)-methyltransferase TrmD [Patescibacteria group bacterium]|nr:tRNA (guanosine(37)-N1)-methyltransferase TrmD [Patescibacteria group bacterium]
MKIDILTLFPDMFTGPFGKSIVKRAIDKKLLSINIHNLRKWSKDKHKTVDGKPFGGGAGMILRVDVIDRALRELSLFSGSSTNSSPLRSGLKGVPSRTDLFTTGTSETCLPARQGSEPTRHESRTDLFTNKVPNHKTKVIFLTPQGKPYKQKKAKELAKLDHIIFICGHYEGIDERIREKFVDEEISIGDYVLSGGEIPTMVVVDSLVRLMPGVLGNDESIKNESFSEFSGPSTDSNPVRSGLKGVPSRTDLNLEVRNPLLLEYPQYTRPADYKGMKVPEVLLSGHHKEIEAWRKNQSIKRTKKVRPDLI